MTTIHIETSVRGLLGTATCHFDGRDYYKENRSIAAALSQLVTQLDQKKVGASGHKWRTTDGLTGVVGNTVKKSRRKAIAEMDTFELLGGQMHRGTQ